MDLPDKTTVVYSLAIIGGLAILYGVLYIFLKAKGAWNTLFGK